MPSLVIVIFVCIFIAFSVFVLKETGYIKVFLKAGFIGLLVLLVVSFLYGLFNDFSFIHGSSSAGLDSAFAYVALLGFLIGPIIFIVGGLCGVLSAYLGRRNKNRDTKKVNEDQ